MDNKRVKTTTTSSGVDTNILSIVARISNQNDKILSAVNTSTINDYTEIQQSITDIGNWFYKIGLRDNWKQANGFAGKKPSAYNWDDCRFMFFLYLFFLSFIY